MSDESEEYVIDPRDLEMYDEILDPNYSPTDEGKDIIK